MSEKSPVGHNGHRQALTLLPTSSDEALATQAPSEEAGRLWTFPMLKSHPVRSDFIFRSSLLQQLTITTLADTASQCKYLGTSLFHSQFIHFQRKSAVAKSVTACQRAVLGIQPLPDDELYPKVVCSNRLLSEEHFGHLLCNLLTYFRCSDVELQYDVCQLLLCHAN